MHGILTFHASYILFPHITWTTIRYKVHSRYTQVHSGTLKVHSRYTQDTLRHTQIYSAILNEGSKRLRKV